MLTLIAALPLAMPLHAVPPVKPVRTFVGETRRNTMVLTLYPDNTYEFLQRSAKKFNRDTGHYRVWGFNRRLKLHSNYPHHWQHKLATGRYYLSEQGLREYNTKGKIRLYPASHYTLDSERNQSLAGEFSVSTASDQSWSTAIASPLPDATAIGNATAERLYQAALRQGFSELRSDHPDLERTLRERSAAICAGITDDSMKFVELCRWIMRHLEYDYEKKDENRDLMCLLESGKTVCTGYANLLNALCRVQRIPSLYVTGQTLDGDKWNVVHGVGHAWNLVKINGKWYGIDLTWLDITLGKTGKIESGSQWYLTQPAILSRTHYPETPALSFHPARQQPWVDFLQNPVLEQNSGELRLLKPLSNVLMPQDGFTEFYFYAARKDTLVWQSESSLHYPRTVVLNPGVNKVRIPAPHEISRSTFSNSRLHASFLTSTDPKPTTLIRYFHQQLDDAYADSIFYQYLLSLNPADSLPLSEELSEQESRQSAWKALLARYDGRNIPHNILHSFKTSNGGLTESNFYYQFRFEMTKIDGKTPVLNFPVAGNLPEGIISTLYPVRLGKPVFDLW